MRWWVVGLLMLLVQAQLARQADAKCLTNMTDFHRKNFFYHESVASTLTIESSERVTHDVASNILLIFLQEVQGYASVRIVYADAFNASAALDRVSEIEDVDDQFIDPTTMINLEVWADANFVVPRDRKVSEVGMITPPGRFGWFVRGRSDVTWQTFQSSDSARAFALDPSTLEKVLARAVAVNCPSSPCPIRGIYSPPRCSSAPCATLLAGHFGNFVNGPFAWEDSSRAVMEHIDGLGLYVQVLFLGAGLADVVSHLPPSSPRLVLTWTPGEVTAFGDWHPVAFPPCGFDDDAPGCVYESRRIIKLVSNRVREGARSAYEAVSSIGFTREEYLQLVRDAVTRPDLTHYELACEWMRSQRDVWKKWTPYPLDDKPVLTICGIFPLQGVLFSASGLPTAANMAVRAVNADDRILPHHSLELAVHDGQCNADRVVNTFINYVLAFDSKRMVGILGPACTDTVEPLVGITRYFRTVVISYSAEGSNFSDREKYPYFFRTIGENQNYKQVYLSLLQRLGWRRMAALTEDGQKYTEYLSHLQDLLQAHNLTFITHRKFPRDRFNATMRTYLEDLQSRRARIIVADVHDSAARAVMCEAHHLHMTAAEGYVWFLPQWLSPNWYHTDSLGRNPREGNCTTAQIRKAMQGHLTLAHQYFASDDTVTHENITVGQWKQKYRNELARTKWDDVESDYAGYTYDAVWTYALALQKLYHANESYLADIHSPDAIAKFVDLIQHTDFVGVSGRIQFLSGPSRTNNINILQWLDGSFNLVGTLIPNISEQHRRVENYRLELNTSLIKWFTPDGLQPGDGEEASSCIFQGLADAFGLECSGAIIVANIIGFGLLAILLVIGIAFTKYRYDKRVEKLEITEKYMKSMGFDLLPNMSDLDKWEIARDCVVINRRLGEGAFGTVYGGEAYFEKDGWVAAAVKTLKVNSTTEQKLDFLSEAEVMKRFDHKNIVKLLGVCTRGEPVYTIMEFMLYGDIKTFLLNRRHLVNARRLTDESNEVSSKKLTQMALDIARGLSYLASLKYIHRDIACRNCLLNSARVAKIGDFGLTRRMFESDYYKFSRKGMLPIRWMAPESLADGLFTTKSDVWAFGVVMWEIVTFGSYPFQGLGNNEVVEHVKAGNTIPLPKNIKPQLECLIKSCWNLDYRKRPEVCEMVAFLANNPRLLSPCLDTPASSVAVEDPDLSLPDLPPSPFNPPCSFFPGEEGVEGDPVTPFDDGVRERLIPPSRAIHIPMTQLAPLASRTPSDTDIQSNSGVSGVL